MQGGLRELREGIPQLVELNPPGINGLKLGWTRESELFPWEPEGASQLERMESRLTQTWTPTPETWKVPDHRLRSSHVMANLGLVCPGPIAPLMAFSAGLADRLADCKVSHSGMVFFLMFI